MIKVKNWKGNNLEGQWLVTLKLDGVRMLRCREGKPISRNKKPLYNLDHIDKNIIDCEIFLKDWETSVSLVRSKNPKLVPEEAIYSLNPLDKRLIHSELKDPTSEQINSILEKVLGLGYEGLVLRQGDIWIKVKQKLTVDVEILGHIDGKGKYSNKLGALITAYGNVGTGFKDSERVKENFPIGTIIEVECMEFTPDNKMRHPRFLRKRFDKDKESEA